MYYIIFQIIQIFIILIQIAEIFKKIILRLIFEYTYFKKSQIMNTIVKLSVFDGILPENSKKLMEIPYWTGKDNFLYYTKKYQFKYEKWFI